LNIDKYDEYYETDSYKQFPFSSLLINNIQLTTDEVQYNKINIALEILDVQLSRATICTLRAIHHW